MSRLRLAIIVLAGAAAYANVIRAPFVFDDDAAIVRNGSIRSWRSALFPPRETPVAGRPLVNLSFAANHAAGGLSVPGYRVVNIGIHLLCAIVLFGVIGRLSGSTDLTFAAALVWTVHPLNSEAVSYVTERTESMMALFYLLTIYAASRGLASSARPQDATLRRRWAMIAIAACALGMLCKESMVTAPLMVVFVDRVFLFPSFAAAWRRRWTLYAGLASTWILLIAVLASNPRPHSAGFSSGVSAITYLMNQPAMIVRYLRLAVWPSDLVIHYGLPQRVTVADVLPSALLVIALLVATAFALRRRPAAGFLGAWFFITLAPTSTIVPIATEVGAERRMYLASAALIALATGAAVGWLLPRRLLRRAGVPVLAIVTLALLAATVARNREYASGLRLAETTLARWPTSVAHAMVGTELAAIGRHDEAMRHLETAKEGYPKALYHLGGEQFNAGRLDEAIASLQAYVRRDPNAIEAAHALTMLGRALMLKEQSGPAIDALRRALAAAPSNADARGFLAGALFSSRAYPEAAAQYAIYLTERPDDADAWTNCAIALAALGRNDEALSAFRHAAEAAPNDARAARNLAAMLVDNGGASEAIAEARRAVRLDPNDASGHDLLGRALMREDKQEEATMEFERALQLDPAFTAARDALGIVRGAKKKG